MKGFLAELKRRKVSRTAVAYAAGAWAVLQVADLFLPLLELPDGSMRLILLVCAAGFPITLILAWSFDLTSKGLVVTEDITPERHSPAVSPLQSFQLILIFSLIMTVGYLYYDRLYGREGSSAEQSYTPAAQSIAVLPFTNMSEDKSNIYFSDGVSEELLDALANVAGLKVAARTSSFFFRDSTETLTEIGRKLGVATVLEGSVRKDGDKVRITAQLIDARSGYHLWSETYDAVLDNIFELQDDIARQVVRAILPMIVDEDMPLAGPTTGNTRAYNEYLIGRALLREPWNDRTLDEARERFELAIVLDEDYAEAYAGLCDALLASYQHRRRHQAFIDARVACNKALTRPGKDISGWDVRIALGALYRVAGEFETSLDWLKLAREYRPELARSNREMGLTYSAAGRVDEARSHFESAIEADRSSWSSYLALANFYTQREHYAKAVEVYDQLLAILPNAVSALTGKGSALYMLGEVDRAETLWLSATEQAQGRNSGTLGEIYTNLGLLYYYRGDYELAVAMHESAARTLGDDHRVWGRIAESYRALGNLEEEESNYATAIQLGEQTLLLHGNDWETTGLLGIYHGNLGHGQEALEYLHAMLELGGSLSTPNYFAALIYWSLGEENAAYTQLQLAAEKGIPASMLVADPDLQRLRELDPERFDQLVNSGGSE